MADINDQHDQTSPTDLDDHAGNGAPGDGPRGVKRSRRSAGSDDDDDDKGGRERRKIEIKFIADKSRRHITFSKRKAGIMKKVSLLLPASQIQRSGNRCRRERCAAPKFSVLTKICETGLRIVCPYRYTGATTGGLRDGSGLHLHYA